MSPFDYGMTVIDKKGLLPAQRQEKRALHLQLRSQLRRDWRAAQKLSSLSNGALRIGRDATRSDHDGRAATQSTDR